MESFSSEAWTVLISHLLWIGTGTTILTSANNGYGMSDLFKERILKGLHEMISKNSINEDSEMWSVSYEIVHDVISTALMTYMPLRQSAACLLTLFLALTYDIPESFSNILTET